MYGVFVSSSVLQKGKHQASLSADILAVVIARALVEDTFYKGFEGIYNAQINRSDPILH